MIYRKGREVWWWWWCWWGESLNWEGRRVEREKRRFGQQWPWATCDSRSALFTSLCLVFEPPLCHTTDSPPPPPPPLDPKLGKKKKKLQTACVYLYVYKALVHIFIAEEQRLSFVLRKKKKEKKNYTIFFRAFVRKHENEVELFIFFCMYVCGYVLRNVCNIGFVEEEE